MKISINKRLFVWVCAIALSSVLLIGCASKRIVYRPVAVPTGLTQPVQKPIKPNTKAATQRDVALFLVEQNSTIDYCNARLKIIKNWSEKWTSPIKQAK